MSTPLTPAGSSLQAKIVVINEQVQTDVLTLREGARPVGFVVGCSGNTVAGTLDVGLVGGTGDEFVAGFAAAPGAGGFLTGTTVALDPSQPLKISATLTGAGAGPVQLVVLYSNSNV